MSEKTFLLELFYKNTGVTYKGLVSESVINKIKKRLFVEFNLLIEYNQKDGCGEDTATYKRLYYHPSENMKVNFTEVNGE
jgi:hypothetical protein